MISTRAICKLSAFIFLVFLSQGSAAATVRVAVASNFANTIKTLVSRFEAQSGHKVVVALGSTGKHYAQIQHGARFDAFLAADVRRPMLLEQNKRAIPGSRFTYAIGKVVLWSPVNGYVDNNGNVLASGDFDHLAIANPKLAPYGQAARQVLQSLELWEMLEKKLVRGENVNQAFQFVLSGNAELGFVALSQVMTMESERQGSYWIVNQSLYQPIEQQAVLLTDNPAARAFIGFIQRDEARTIIQEAGYDVP